MIINYNTNTMSHNSIENSLNTLLTRNYDAEKGYANVSEKVDHPEMRSFMLNNSNERREFGKQIKDILNSHGLEIHKGSSIVADMHRAWIDLKGLLSQNSDKAILEEATRGEELAIDDYKKAIDNPEISPEDKRVLSDHLKSIMSSYEQLSKLKATVS